MHRYLGTLKLCISNSCTYPLLALCWQMYTFQLPWKGLYTPETQVCHAAHSRPPELHIWLARVTELQQEPSLAQQVWEILKTNQQKSLGVSAPPSASWVLCLGVKHQGRWLEPGWTSGATKTAPQMGRGEKIQGNVQELRQGEVTHW